MAKKGNASIVKLRSTESAHRYYTTKNRKNTKERMQLRKYDPTLCRHAIYKEER
jgi:large subunit ribosomal protein L33